ncbi:tudor domain-containing protein 5-like [Aphis craccivora]|uniref:Tudor domain-containing protein 5-like n=1 Tax=Aphis craccivora TaxID=307492 RepID=A0A6G0YIP3_APHCR|nr:tudor domain-containing protein 5-like [Aphis craccivora]
MASTLKDQETIPFNDRMYLNFNSIVYVFKRKIFFNSDKHIDSYNSYGSNIISDTMKIKLRRLLSKHKDGILCNNFLNVYSY